MVVLISAVGAPNSPLGNFINLQGISAPPQLLTKTNNNIDELSAIIIKDQITESIENFESRVQLIRVSTFPDFDNNSFDVTVIYEIIGADIPPQELQFVLQQTR